MLLIHVYFYASAACAAPEELCFLLSVLCPSRAKYIYFVSQEYIERISMEFAGVRDDHCHEQIK